jgi:hypothetical protein
MNETTYARHYAAAMTDEVMELAGGDPIMAVQILCNRAQEMRNQVKELEEQVKRLFFAPPEEPTPSKNPFKPRNHKRKKVINGPVADQPEPTEEDFAPAFELHFPEEPDPVLTGTPIPVKVEEGPSPKVEEGPSLKVEEEPSPKVKEGQSPLSPNARVIKCFDVTGGQS